MAPNKAQGRCVIVTGGDSGIGAACVMAFAGAGDRVAILYHQDHAAAEAVAHSVRGKGGQARIVPCSVDEEASVEAAFAAIEADYGPAEVLVNSAGVNMQGVHVREMSLADWRARIDTDLTGAFLTSKRFLKGRGEDTAPAAILHISSIHAEVVRAGGAAYSAAKGGLKNLVEALAIEEATRGVRVNAIEPGMILTPMNARAMQDDAYRKTLEKNIPMQRAGQPDEVARLALWLASEEAGYITGANIVIDGGLSLLLGVGA